MPGYRAPPSKTRSVVLVSLSWCRWCPSRSRLVRVGGYVVVEHFAPRGLGRTLSPREGGSVDSL
jgi:hypothetical protein